MLDAQLLKDINTKFDEKRITFSKDDRDFNSGRDNRFGRLQGVFTRDYWKRDELFRVGEIFYAYTFKAYVNEMSFERPYPTWILFSPHHLIQENPNFYRDISSKIREIITKKGKLNRKEKIIKSVFESNYEEPHYLEIPDPYNLGYLCYISICYVKPNHFSDFHPGINLVVAAKTVSKEIVYLPELYWNEEYKNMYYKNSEDIGNLE